VVHTAPNITKIAGSNGGCRRYAAWGGSWLAELIRPA
jgi:hypothetical protein